jgi:hypothetical protein
MSLVFVKILLEPSVRRILKFIDVFNLILGGSIFYTVNGWMLGEDLSQNWTMRVEVVTIVISTIPNERTPPQFVLNLISSS